MALIREIRDNDQSVQVLTLSRNFGYQASLQAGLSYAKGTAIIAIGPPYPEVLSLPVRRYAYQMLKSLQVELIFVEDGVSFRKLVRVFRTLFEIYDKGAGQKHSEDVHFQGMTKVKVMFHDFDVDEPFRSSKYPEPKFAR